VYHFWATKNDGLGLGFPVQNQVSFKQVSQSKISAMSLSQIDQKSRSMCRQHSIIFQLGSNYRCTSSWLVY